MYMELIKNMKVIKKLEDSIMGTTYYSDFESMVKHFAQILDTGALQRDIGFTPHDFSHHCKNIYEILGILLPDQFYERYPNGENLKLLLVAVLLHDIGMANNADEQSRCKHSELGREYIFRKVAQNESSITDHIEDLMIDPLGDIIYAHSDIKKLDGEIQEDTFSEVVQKYNGKQPKGTYEDLNIPYLAAVLRLADELDISNSRIKGTGYEDKYNTDSSKMHYDICKYLKRVQYYNESPTVLFIETEDALFSTLSEDESYTVAAQILGKYRKICKEFELVYNKVLSKTQYASEDIWKITKISLKDEDKYLELSQKKKS